MDFVCVLHPVYSCSLTLTHSFSNVSVYITCRIIFHFLSIDPNLRVCPVVISLIISPRLCHFSAPLPYPQQSVHFMSDIDSSHSYFVLFLRVGMPLLVALNGKRIHTRVTSSVFLDLHLYLIFLTSCFV